MDAFLDKVKVVFPEFKCARNEHYEQDETVFFTLRTSHTILYKWNLLNFCRKLMKLVEETPDLYHHTYIGISYKVVAWQKTLNMFGNEIPRFTTQFTDFECKNDEIDEIPFEFFEHVDKEKFVDFNFFEVDFKGINGKD